MSTARAITEMREHFLTPPFADVRDAIESVGATWSISSQGDGTLCAPPLGGEATIIVQGRTPDRRFGIVLLTGGWALRGLRGKKFRIDDLRDEVQNEDFMAELKRRLNCPGATRTETIDTAENNSLAHWKYAKKARNDRTAAWNQNCY